MAVRHGVHCSQLSTITRFIGSRYAAARGSEVAAMSCAATMTTSTDR